MITKKQFVEIINRLKSVNDFVEETNDKARKLKDAIESDFYNTMSLSISHESIVVTLLENMFSCGDIISWWIYDLEYGTKYKDGCITEQDGSIIDVSTVEKLYDYLIKKKEETEDV